jgi:hypothetical protein
MLLPIESKPLMALSIMVSGQQVFFVVPVVPQDYPILKT